MAEHLRNAPPTVVSYLRRLMNAMSVANYIPPSLCCGDLITIPKKGKDPLAMNNHRGITITSVLGKLLEHLLMSRVRALLRESQHDLQFGFTPGLSPGLAALICTEVLANNRDEKKDTYVATIDVSKAFDCVWHDSVLRKLFLNTSGNSAWSLLALLMRNTQIRVCLGALRSRPVTLNQGVGQGRIPSTDEYKLHLDSLLHILGSTNIGSHIGPFFCGAPTCADDVMLIYFIY